MLDLLKVLRVKNLLVNMVYSKPEFNTNRNVTVDNIKYHMKNVYKLGNSMYRILIRLITF